ncbi:GL22306 [Drosophila persimilis]|uniref:GL22306 n=3 Tax=Drosophila persimilis TaxID=7234 RepID=B4GG05_DROPE|nr:GL22306 [Drosophila persimilis]
MSPISNSNSYSSVDTNQTLLNSLANQQRGNRLRQQQQQPQRSPKYSQFMIITPAVSIDRDFEYESHLDYEDFANAAHNNGNLFRLGLRRSDSSNSGDSGHSSDSSSFRSNYNQYLHHSRQHLLSKGNGNGNGGGGHHFYTFSSSWRWCSLLCAAMRCFGAGGGGAGNGNAPYSSSLQHHRLRRCSSYNAENAYEHFAAPFKPRKTRDHMNNITYEL